MLICYILRQCCWVFFCAKDCFWAKAECRLVPFYLREGQHLYTNNFKTRQLASKQSRWKMAVNLRGKYEFWYGAVFFNPWTLTSTFPLGYVRSKSTTQSLPQKSSQGTLRGFTLKLTTFLHSKAFRDRQYIKALCIMLGEIYSIVQKFPIP